MVADPLELGANKKLSSFINNKTGLFYLLEGKGSCISCTS